MTARSLTVTIVLAGWVMGMSGQPNKAADQENQPSAQSQQPQVSRDSHDTHNYSNHKNSDGKAKPLHWYESLKRPEWLLVILAIPSIGFVGWQTWETRRAANTSNRTMISQFRPKIAIRAIKLDPSSYMYFDRRGDGIWKIVISVANTGGTRAVIAEGIGYLQTYKKDYPIDELTPWWILESPISIEAGERVEIIYPLDARRIRDYMEPAEAETILKDREPERYPIFRGTIKYRDEIGITRQTGFCRQWSFRKKGFEVLDDPEFEYQD